MINPQWVQDKVEDVLEYLQDAPIDLTSIILHDELYELCEQAIFDELAEDAEDSEDD